MHLRNETYYSTQILFKIFLKSKLQLFCTDFFLFFSLLIVCLILFKNKYYFFRRFLRFVYFDILLRMFLNDIHYASYPLRIWYTSGYKFTTNTWCYFTHC